MSLKKDEAYYRLPAGNGYVHLAKLFIQIIPIRHMIASLEHTKFNRTKHKIK